MNCFKTRDGTSLRLYEWGDPQLPPLIIVNAIGIPILLASRLAERLSHLFHVISWDQRGSDCSVADFLARPHDYAAFVQDVAEIVGASKQADCPMVGICSGASLLVRAVAQELISPRALVLVSPLMRFEHNNTPSQFESTVVPFMRLVARGDRVIAQQMVSMGKLAAAAPAPADPDLRAIQAAERGNLESVEAIGVYARSVTEFMSQIFDSDITHVRQDTLVISAEQDKMVSAASARRLAATLPKAQFREYGRWGHHSVYLDAALRDDVARFLGSDVETHRRELS